MNSTVEEINAVQRRVKVTVSSDAVNKAFEAAYARLQKKAKIHGFRPGKAPISVIKRVYGSNVSYEVGEQLINDHLFPAIKEHGVNPIASPFVEVDKAPDLNADYVFSAIVDVMPKIELDGAHRGLVVQCKHFTSDESTIERELKGLARRQAKTSALADEAVVAAAGHLAVISHTAQLDGKELSDMAVKATPVGLGLGEMFPDLEEAILGMRKGEQKEVDITLPADYEDEQLAGKAVHFTIQLDDLMALEMPNLDDDFAKDLNFDSFADLRKSVESQLATTISNMNKQEFEKQLIDALMERVSFEVPPTMVDQVVDSMIYDIRFKDEADRKKALKDEQVRKSMRPEAKIRARNTMALWEVIKTEGLEVSDEEVREHIKGFVREGEADAAKQIDSTFNNLGERIRENLLFEKAIAFLKTHANITETTENL